jgi:hypothetical protein
MWISYIAEISEVYTASIFSIKMSKETEFVYIHDSVSTKSGRRQGKGTVVPSRLCQQRQ